ncbi:MAG TPA: Gmad2 immunoglobulin-like domain-containing protein [Candidatus Limnocylindrales bacterium]|nr:Gmad2 immunoglobulin-like domain-containing protein [Candidatus Limnocylindrales bacterium]
MNRPTLIRHRPLLVSMAIVLFVAACAAASGDLGGVATPPPTGGSSPDVPTVVPTTSADSPGASPAAAPAASPTGSTTVRTYFFLGSFSGNFGLAPVERQIAQTQAVGAASIGALLAGPIDPELSASPAMYTRVPEGTRFLGLQISNGVATVNLSSEFEAGGDSLSVAGRIAQVVYTLTQFPTVNGVRFEFDGVPPKGVFIGGFTRADYTAFLPAIFLDRPAWGGTLGTPARVSGMADVFEATFRIAILDSAGTVLVDQRAMASCGTGCWGTFDVTIPYHVARAQSGILRVYDLSAKDGSRENVTEYPVTLTPGG